MTRLLSPSEIELWELARKADAETPSWWENDGEVESALSVVTDYPAEIAAFISKANPLTISSLLETLENTREALLTTALRDTGNPDHDWNTCPELSCVMARRALSGFSGDASKEEK